MFSIMRLFRLYLFLTLGFSGAWLVGACSDDDSEQNSFAREYCALLMPCCNKVGLSNDPAICQASIEAMMHISGFSESKHEQCLAAMRAASSEADYCTKDGLEFEECETLFVSRGDTQPGGACEWHFDCARSPQGTPICMPHAEEGDSYGSCVIVADGKVGDSPCVGTKHDGLFLYATDAKARPLAYGCDQDRGNYCNEESLKCEPVALLGQSCSPAPCEDGTFCDHEGKTCVPNQPAGAPCIFSDECEGNLFCDGVCKSLLPIGSACMFGSECISNHCENKVCAEAPKDTGLAWLCGV